VDTWDQPVNNDWSYIDTAFGGVVGLNATGISAHTLTLTEYRPLIIEVTGAISNNVVYTIPSGIGGQWIVYNYTTDATGGPWTISFTCAGSGYSISCPRATTTNLMCDGVNVNFADGRPGSPGGSNTQVQYNNNGTLAGSSNFVFTGTNVGIGTASPTNSLHLYYNSTSQTSLNVEAGAAATYAPGIYLSDSRTGSVKQFQLSVGGYSNSFYVQDMTASAVRMLIDTNGNVGIGTTAPSGKLQVQVSGTSNPSFIAEDGLIVSSTAGSGYTNAINIVSGSTGTAKLKFSSSATNNLGYTNYDMTTNSMYFGTNSSERMRIDSSGNVGIGTSSPSSFGKFAVTGSAGTTYVGAGGDQLAFSKGGTNYISTATAGGQIQFQTGAGSNSMLIDSSGNVGIGTNLPSQLLQVAGTIYSSSGGFKFPDGTTQTTSAGVISLIAGANISLSGSTGNITISASSSGGTVTSVSTGIGLSGGPITTSGTISIVTTFSAVGTYAFLYYNGGTVASGSSVTSNGANLFPCDTNIANVSAVGSGQVWQCMGYMGGAAATLWLRTS
jgi:hypothetical protein